MVTSQVGDEFVAGGLDSVAGGLAVAGTVAFGSLLGTPCELAGQQTLPCGQPSHVRFQRRELGTNLGLVKRLDITPADPRDLRTKTGMP